MPDKNPWDNFDPWSIAGACEVVGGRTTVEENWPHLHYALDELGIADRLVQAGVIGTVAIETASTFRPVREAFWMTEEWRRANLHYYPYYGRGYIQLTWRSNYVTYGQRIGADLVNNPDRALDVSVSAWVLAFYFLDRGVADAARAENWADVRRLVWGANPLDFPIGHPGRDAYERLLRILRTLGV